MQTKSSTSFVQTASDSTLHKFLNSQLQDMYWVEQRLVKTLPKLEESATSNQLKEAFNTHLGQTRTHVSRLENVFEMIGEEATAKKCPAIAGIIDEGEDLIDETDKGSAQRDVALIFAGQKAEHYEIATYGGLISLARTLGYNDAAEVLSETLSEEKEADSLLTQIAENDINYQARNEKG
jgi:ferritin-like metal-binding protein YciE